MASTGHLTLAWYCDISMLSQGGVGGRQRFVIADIVQSRCRRGGGQDWRLVGISRRGGRIRRCGPVLAILLILGGLGVLASRQLEGRNRSVARQRDEKMCMGYEATYNSLAQAPHGHPRSRLTRGGAGLRGLTRHQMNDEARRQ